MDGLRWLLLLFGALAIAGIYLYSRRERDKPPREQAAAPRRTPILDDEANEFSESGATETNGPAAEMNADAASETSDQTPQKIVTLRLVARNKGAFRGDKSRYAWFLHGNADQLSRHFHGDLVVRDEYELHLFGHRANDFAEAIDICVVQRCIDLVQ